MKRSIFIIVVLIFCLCPIIACTQNNDAGKPFITNWLPKEYNADAQTWGVAQDSRGIMYFGNSNGLLEFDGVTWRVLEFTENSFVRSLAIGANKNIYIGGKGEIGYFLPVNEFQKNSGLKNPYNRKYISLTRFLHPNDRDFTDVWRTCISSQYVFFQTKKHLFRYSLSQAGKKDSICKNCMHVFTNDDRFGGLAIVNNHVYTATAKDGLLEVIGDTMVSLPDGKKIGSGFSFIVPYNDSIGSKKMLIATEAHQLYIYDGKTCELLGGVIADLVKQFDTYDAVTLSDGTIAIATQGSGVVIINPMAGGKIIHVLNKATGMKADIAYNLYVGKQGALWITTNNGIGRVEATSPLSNFDEVSGLNGVGYSIEKFQNQIYLATEVGVSYLQETKTTGNIPLPTFNFVQGLHHWTWCLLPLPSSKEMLAGTEEGVYKIRDNKATLLVQLNHDVICMHRSAYDSNRIFLGLRYGGIASIYYNHTNDTWTNEGNIPGVDEYIYSINESSDGSLWLTAKYNPYLIKIAFRSVAKGAEMHKLQVKHYDTTQGLPEENAIRTTIIAKQLYAYALGKVFRYNASTDKFNVDTNIINFRYDGEFIQEDKAGNIWFDCNNSIYRAIPKNDGGFTIDSVSFLRIEPQQYYAMYADESAGTVWFAGSNELIHYNTHKQKNINTYFSALIRNVNLIGADSVLYDGLPVEGLDQQPTLLYNQNALRFTYAATSYDNPSANQYQYFLEGFDKDWSGWTSETKKDYTNLPEGNYQFHVRAKNIYKHISSEAMYSFEVLPPWWRTWWAYALYAIGFIAIVGLLIRWRISSIHNEKLVLERKVLQRTVELKKEKEKVESTLSELKAAQSQLIQSEKMASLGELTAGIAHEIQNPLNFVNNFSEVNKEMIDELQTELQSGNLDGAISISNDIKDNSEKINHHGKRADAIVKGMLQHSRTSSGKKEPTDINALCDEYLRLSYHGLRAKDKSFNAEMKTDFDASLPKINVVPQDISRVILNLINNAFYAVSEKQKAAGENYKPLVTVATKSPSPLEKGWVEVSVKDNGNGIPEKIKDKIFQPFFTTKPTGSGTGLGLSLSYDIVKAHGGEIKVESKENEGTEFKILLSVI
ncbi:MAG: hypothetical protein JSS67_08310 [Bacteroidetes bacterium]|nr:hypothetical protein [Bacteroidota bacterium]